MSDAAEDRRLELQLELLDRLEGLETKDEDELAVALVSATAAIIARSYPGKPNAAAKRLIKDNYPEATANLMAERAMAPEGVFFTLASAQKLGSIALSYSPLAHIKSHVDHDNSLDRSIGKTLAGRVQTACIDATANGISDFGAVTTAIFAALTLARSRDVETFKIAKALIDALQFVLEGYAPPVKEMTRKEIEDAAIRKLAEIAGLSVSAARRYLPHARKLMDS